MGIFVESPIVGKGPAWPAWAQLVPGLGPPTWAWLGPTHLDPAWAHPLGPGWGPSGGPERQVTDLLGTGALGEGSGWDMRVRPVPVLVPAASGNQEILGTWKSGNLKI